MLHLPDVHARVDRFATYSVMVRGYTENLVIRHTLVIKCIIFYRDHLWTHALNKWYIICTYVVTWGVCLCSILQESCCLCSIVQESCVVYLVYYRSHVLFVCFFLVFSLLFSMLYSHVYHVLYIQELHALHATDKIIYIPVGCC